jgi:pyruvate,water dikinase
MSSANAIAWFDEIGAGDIALVGGKGANLGEMARAGLPVPPGFCVVARAYRDFIARSGLEGAIRRTVAETDLGDPAVVEASTGRIREWITCRPIPNALAAEIAAAYRRLAERAGEPAGGVPVAVRSSATAEDLPTASFAGQQDTYLNVRGVDALLDHVRRCWASLWTARALTYRAAQGFEHDKVHLAVVVQAMIPSEVAGILFTANPVSGSCDEAVINASWGLGEAVVSGLVSPDTIVADKRDGRVIARTVALKERMIVYVGEGGTLEQEIPAEQRGRPALTDEQVAELVALGRRIETHYGRPQDIEWGYARGRCYVLQARPITTLTRAPAAAPLERDETDEFNRTMFVEIFPDPLSPAFLSVIKPLFKTMLDFTFRQLGFRPPAEIEAIGAFYNQPYFNRRYIEAALAPLSPAVRAPLVAQIVNPFGADEQPAPAQLSWAYLGLVARTLRFIVRFPKQLPGLLARYRAEIARIEAYPLAGSADAEIVTQIRRLVFEAAGELLSYDFLMIAMIGRTYRILGALLTRLYRDKTDEVVAGLISGVTGNVTMETNKRLWDLAQVAKASPVVCGLLRRFGDAELRARLEALPAAREFLAALDEFLGVYGHREIRMDILYPTWGEDPAPVFGFVRSYLDAAESQSPYAQQERLRHERAALAEAVLAAAAEGLAGRLLLAPLLRWVLDQAEIHTRERDTMHFELTRLFPPLRRLMLELGARWQQRGALDAAEDIFFLELDEIEALAGTLTAARAKVRARRDEFAANRRRAWPDRVCGGVEVYAGREARGPAPEGALAGVAGSPGIAKGAARIIRGPEEFGRLQRGDILVAPLTNPVWTPLFAVAGGIVTEVGGILSHGAIVAREYGIPAVMSVSAATQRIVEGQQITVDGYRGSVFVEA